MIPLDAAAALHDAGGKARTLARARAAGLPVLDGFVVLARDELDAAAIAAALGRLGGTRFAVRSSATVEDLPGASAAGVFESVIDVGAGEVVAAIERVRQGAFSQSAKAYLGARGLLAGRLQMAVLVQPLAPAARVGVLHTAPIEHESLLAEERALGQPEWGAVEPRRVALTDPLAVAARRLAAMVGGEADVEYALTDHGPLVLQARPLTAPPPARDPARWTALTPGTWLLDAEHNPEPLSAAQTSLVERSGRVPGLSAQRVVHGWLFVRVAPPSEAANPESSHDHAATPAAELLQSSIVPRAEALLAPLEAQAEPPLADTLRAFDEVARMHGVELRPLLGAARRALDRLLQSSVGEPLAAHGELLAGTGGRTLLRDQSLWSLGHAEAERRPALLAAHLAEYGAYAPAWDVAVAPDDEDAARVERMAALLARTRSPEQRHPEAVARAEAAARRLADRMSPPDAPRLAALLPPARDAMALAEDDDALFFRALRLVRRALLAIGQRATANGQLDGAWQIFDLPIEDALAGTLDAGRAHGKRALAASRSRLAPPALVRDGVPSWHGAGGGVLLGAGTSGRGFGRALVLRDPLRAPARLPEGAVLIVSALLPSLTYLIPGASALVTDVGGALSHAATLAREYGVPAVLGTGSATRAIADGEDLIVDADHGRVFRLGGG